MKHNYILFPTLALLALAVAPQGWARSISEQRAIELAQQFTHTSSHLRMAAAAGQQLRVAHVAQSATTQAPLYYAIEQGTAGGFVLVAGDDLVQQPVLAYCDHGNFSYDEAPANVRWWLDEYARMIDYAIARGMQVTSVASLGSSVEPLLTTHWNQLYPYNTCCPIADGEQTATGCVATALAQVLNYHQWPKQGTGSYSYEYNGQTLSADFGQTTYDWDNMLDDYDENSSEEAIDAVATLMYHCGIAVEMSYDIADNGGSGAPGSNAFGAVANYFGYGKDASYRSRCFYPYSDWIGMLKDELDARRPIYYGGLSTDGGHAFVIDGYNAQGLFHINWGWGGYSDGYFSIITLAPEEQGTGAGSDSGYYIDQQGLFNLHPADGTEQCEQELYLSNFYMYDHNNGNKPVYEIDIEKGGSVTFRVADFINSRLETLYGDFALFMVDQYFTGCDMFTYSLQAGLNSMCSASCDIEVTLSSELGDGTYYLYPVYLKDEYSVADPVTTNLLAPDLCVVTISGDNVHMEMDDNRFSQIVCNSVEVTSNTTMTNGQVATVECSLTNNSSEYFTDMLSFIISRHGSYEKLYQCEIYGVAAPLLAPGETVTMTMEGIIDGFTPIEGEDFYDIYIVDQILGMPVPGAFATVSLDGSGVDNVAASKAAVSVYPNPVAHQLSIQASGRIDGVTIYDLAGATVLRTTGSTTIDVAKLPAGVYMVKIDTPAGSTIEKVVKE